LSPGKPGWFESLAVRGKLGAVFGIQLAVLSLGTVAVLIALVQMSEARRWTDHTHRVIEQVEAMRGEAVEQQAGLRGYIITGQQRFLEPYRYGVVEFENVAQRLRVLIRDNPAQYDRYSRVLTLMDEWQTDVAARDIAYMEDPATHHLAVEATIGGGGKRRIDAIKRLCEEMILEERRLLVSRSGTMERVERLLFGLIVGLLLVGWFTGAYAVSLVNRLLGAPLSRLADLVPRLITGEAVAVPHLERRDEVGTLARAFERLRDASAEQRRADWVREQAARVLGALQHCDSDAAFSETLINRLCGVLEGGYGLAYRWNEQSALLEWCAGFGLPDASVTRRRFRLGEGMVGQSMVERRILEMMPVPAGYLQIVSGLGAAAPASVLFAPLTARGETVGVVEIGLLKPMTTAQRELLEQVIVTSALAWHSVSRSVRTRELLEESRGMTDELQSQQESLRAQGEELRSANEALRGRGEQLEEQGRRLRASEEELRAQAEELRITNSALEEKTGALRMRQDELEAARIDLERKASDLEQASRYKSEFLANMSHELRTPLNSMLILSKMLADNSDGNLDAEQVESARIMHDSGRSLLSLINDILDLSKVEAGKMGVALETVNVSTSLHALLERFRPLAGERGLKFTVRIEPDAPQELETDGARLAQILSNLLSNAFKFTHEGEIELLAKSAQIGIVPGISLSVRDTGIGIPAGKLDRVFQAFEQADSSTSRRYGGTGLGLSIVSGMTTLLGGQVKVRSEEGKGSTFTIVLPERSLQGSGAPPAKAAGPAGVGAAPSLIIEPESGEPPTGTPALLIVEDDRAFAKVLADIATRRGLDVVTAGTGRDALALARRRKLFGVLLDIGLPDMSGWEVLERLKASRYTADVPVHVVSGGDDSERGKELGAVGFLRKPVDRESVVQALERVGAGNAPRRRRLLLVDHDPASRADIVALLSAENAGIVEAGSAAEGLAHLQAEAFDGLILDPDLADMPNFEFLANASAKTNLPPVVIYSRRELTSDESLRLREYTGSIVIHGARSSERLIDEVHLFLHAIERPGRPPAAPEPRAPVADLAGKTVLVVDDDMRNVFALSKTLRMRGLNVVMAQDGHKALAQLEARNDIDIVLMDIMMPGMDGYETIRRIRSATQWQRLPIIAVTAKAMKGDREKCIEAGANDYCAKPIDIDQLVSLLRVWA
jgi:signal transduction histidine kinase/CheY-like chemotaxis protein/CHASE3 domain sensor protein